jgi:diadenosine tetraphosphate (Ap4A) HIT family hydrolase
MATDCVFCRIARREIAAHIVHEDDAQKRFGGIGWSMKIVAGIQGPAADLIGVADVGCK